MQPVETGKTRLDQKYEKKLNVITTIRNWNTVTNLLQIYKERMGNELL
jgi:uncharacterized protein (DUF1697 family)